MWIARIRIDRDVRAFLRPYSAFSNSLRIQTFKSYSVIVFFSRNILCGMLKSFARDASIAAPAAR